LGSQSDRATKVTAMNHSEILFVMANGSAVINPFGIANITFVTLE